MAKPTIKQILYKWLGWRLKTDQPEVRNSDMAQVVKFGKKRWGKTHNASTYERQFRKVRANYPGRFEDISQQHPEREEKTWEIQQPEPEKAGV